MMNSFVFSTTKSIFNETAAVQRIAEVCQQLKINSPLIITDQGIIDIGLIEQLTAPLIDAKLDYHCYSRVVADPPEAIINEAVEFAQQNNIDGVIGFGGGSSLDTAKLVALLVNSDEKLSDIYGIDLIKGQRLPLILIPTTAGTGSEVTPIAIVTTGETTKAGVISSTLLPDVAILDANLTLDLPAPITAATGIDAMVHAIEAYTSVHKRNPYSNMLAKEALTLLSENIVEATFNGKNIEARQAMLLGACLAGQAFANSPVAAVHALAYPLGGHFHIPHGLSNSLVLPHVMRFNFSEAAKEYAELAPFINSAIDCTGSDINTAGNLVNYICTLIKKLELPNNLAAMGIVEDEIELLAESAMHQTRLLVNNPKTVTINDAIEIYSAAFQGI
jgi:alcohol dehydrogenase class IV